jgi:hypothetical protein
VGGALSAGEPLSLDTWSLPAVVEHMQDAYCGTLTAELDHLASQYAPLIQFWACPCSNGHARLIPSESSDLSGHICDI